jgi:hypothetical protein
MAGTGPAAGGGRGWLGASQARLIRIAGRNSARAVDKDRLHKISALSNHFRTKRRNGPTGSISR